MVVAAGLREELHAAAVVLPEFDDVRGVVFEGDGLVSCAVARDQEHTGLDRGQEAFGRLQRLGLGFVVVRVAELGLVERPILRAALALVRQRDATGPGTDVAHAVVEIEHADAIRVQTRPSVHVETATGDPEERRLGGEAALAVEFFVGLFPGRHRAGGTELVAHTDIHDMPPLLDEAVFERLQVAAELADPKPRLSRRGFLWDLHRDGFTVDGEFFDRSGRGDGAKGQSEQSEEDAGHGGLLSAKVQTCKGANVATEPDALTFALLHRGLGPDLHLCT